MPQLLQTIYEIAIAKGRNVLCVVFGDPRIPSPYSEGLNVLDDELIPQTPVAIRQSRSCELPTFRDAADDAAFHHRTRTPATRHQLPHRDGSGHGAGRFGYRDGDDWSEKESEL